MTEEQTKVRDYEKQIIKILEEIKKRYEQKYMSVKMHIEKHKNQMELIGGIFTALNRLENGINHIISSAFVDPNCRAQEKMYFIGTILADERIFCKFEEKRLMFIRLIEAADYLIRTNKITIEFDKEKYLELAKKIKKYKKLETISRTITYCLMRKESVAITKGNRTGNSFKRRGRRKVASKLKN